jgi:hypothetical protein
MGTRTIAGKEVQVNDEGFLTDATEWNRDIAAAIAVEEGIPELTADHWTVIDWARDTAKGTVALMRPPADSVARTAEPASPTWIIFPRYVAGAPAVLEPKSKAQTLMRLVEQAFNYDVLGARGFEAAAGLIDRCACFEFSYGNLDEAIATFASLVSE